MIGRMKCGACRYPNLCRCTLLPLHFRFLFRIQPALLHRRLHSSHILLHILPIKLCGFRISWAIRVRVMQQTLYRCQDRGDIIRRGPSILEDVQTELAVGVYIRVEHPGKELDSRGLVGVGFVKGKKEFESAVFKGGFGRTKYNGVP